MFSIARYNGDAEEEKDNRTLEKKQERLNKLNARIANKKRKDDSSAEPQQDKAVTPVEKKRKSNDVTETKDEVNEPKPTIPQKKVIVTEKKKAPVTEKKKTTSEKKQAVVEDKSIVEAEVEDQGSAVDEDTVMVEETVIEEEIVTEEEPMEVVDEDVPTLEAFPDMLGPKTKQSKEDAKLLKSMGIPEWMLQPTIVSPKDSCELDKAGLSDHLIQRCKDLGLSSLFAGKMTNIKIICTLLKLATSSSNGSYSRVFKKTGFV